MITYLQAIQIIEEVAARSRPSGRVVPLMNSLGSIVEESVLSREEVPSFDNSAMDGFAVFSKDTLEASTRTIRIPVQGIVAAGDLEGFQKARATGRGQAVEIMTGAPVPEGGYDAVIKIEDVRVERGLSGEAIWIEISRPVQSGENIRKKGSDFAFGDSVLKKGTRIATQHIMACASLGFSEVSVRPKPRVAVISTGSELVDFSTSQLQPGMIRNSTGPFLISALKSLGIDVQYLGIVRDDPKIYQNKLEQVLLEGVDLVLSTGAVSMGKYDFVPDVLEKMGAKSYFHKVAIRPGKPVLFSSFTGKFEKTSFFGLPGNPVSTAVGLRFFIEPYIRSFLGLGREKATLAKLSAECSKPKDLRCFYKASTRLGTSGLEVKALHGQASYIVSTLLDANSWVVLTETGNRSSLNEEVEIYPIHSSFEGGLLS